MAEAHGNGIGNVVGFRNCFQPQFMFDRVLNLFLTGASASGQKLFDLRCRVVDDGQFSLGSAQQNNATRMGHQYGCLRISGVREDLFDRQDGWIEVCHNVPYASCDFVDTLSQSQLRCTADDATFAQNRPFGGVLDDSVAGAVETGIDAQDTNARD